MSANRRYLIHIPVLSEYLFRLIATCPEERLRNLSQQERLMLKDTTAINKFCANYPFEYLMFILTKLGFEWAVTIGPTDEAIERSLESCTLQYDNNLQRLDAIQTIGAENVCAFSSRDVMATIMMCAQNCNTDVYKLTYVSQNLKAISGPAGKQPYDIQTKQASEEATVVNRLMMEQLYSLEYVYDTMGLNMNKLKILLALFNKRHSAMTTKDLAKTTRQEDKKRYIYSAIEELVKEDYVTSDRTKTKKYGSNIHYMISTRGIQKIGEYHNCIWENTLK